MTAQPQTQESFAEEFKALEKKFNALKPEVEVTLKDESAGVEGYLVVWNTGISVGGPLEKSGKGGTRITPTVSLEEVKMLAKTMALKNAAAGLPLGGAKSGLKANPDAPDFEKKYRRFAQLMKPHLHENGGLYGGFGFDIGARPIHPKWICDELKSTRCFTGKPVEMGGTDYDKEGIAGLGVATAAIALLKTKYKQPRHASFAVQGLGAMGAAVIRYFSEQGATLKAISDPRFGGTYVFKDSAPPELLKALSEMDSKKVNELLATGSVEPTDAEDVLYCQVDVLFPCAVHNVIREDNVDRIKAKNVVEGANGPCTDGARAALQAKGITVIPDFIANPGGIIAAFVELTSKITPEENTQTRAKVNEAKQITIARITANIEKLMKLVTQHSIDTVKAGRYMAYKNIFEGVK
ncbi:MAG: Glu/Leu/Phe/Val dehydrogenase [Alphaproteobacteria bacterium]